jgi:hypothetical protein
MIYKVINNFFDENFCKDLIKDSEKYLSSENSQKINVNRDSVNSSSIAFYDLCKNSENFRQLEKRINSEDFLDYCFSTLGLSKKKYKLVNFFNKKSLSKFEIKFKKIGMMNIKSLKIFTILKYILIRIVNSLIRITKFSKIFYPFSRPVELLFDYSVAGQGYKREIHRDTDSRLIVFLIYLNQFNDDNQSGGNLELYELLDGNNNYAQPKPEFCKIKEIIKPQVGKLVVFLNSSNSYHAVSEIKALNNKRYFIYGGFTLLSGNNIYIKNKNNLKTDFYFYE